MKSIVLAASLLFAQVSFGQPSLNCKNADGGFQLMPTTPCQHCDKHLPAYLFIGGEGVIEGDIPAYEPDMGGYIAFDQQKSKRSNEDVLSLIDGGTWTIIVEFPNGYFATTHAPGEKVDVTISSSYSDINEGDLEDVRLTCTVQ